MANKIKNILAVVVFSAFMAGGCASTSHHGMGHLEKELSLDRWLDDVAIPYLVKELSEDPRFKGQPFLLVSMKGDNVQPRIDDLTLHIRERLVDSLLTRPGIGLIWRPAIKPWQHHTSLAQVECNPAAREKIYVGIDSAISDFNGKLYVKIRALDISEKKWVTGFGISWEGEPDRHHQSAIQNSNPDNYLLGLRPLPFGDKQADLLAAYLSKNLSCLFTNMELDEVIVHVDDRNLGRIRYFENTFSLVKNYLAKYREVTVTDKPAAANIVVVPKVHEIYQGFYQVWVSAKYKNNGQYIPGRETEAYVFLEDREPIAKPAPKKTVVPPPAYERDLDLCFYDFREGRDNDLYALLRKYPRVTRVERQYGGCHGASMCVCYDISVYSAKYGKMEELMLWLDANLGTLGENAYRLEPVSEKKIRVVFTRGFE